MANSTRIERFKYGVCLNDECPKCKTKEVQQISMRKELVCSECGKELRECPAPKKTNLKPIIIGAIVALALAIAGACFFLFSDSQKNLPPKEVVTNPDTLANEQKKNEANIEEEKPDTASAEKTAADTELEIAKAEAEKAKAEAEKAKAEAEAAKAARPIVVKQEKSSSSSSGSVRLSYGSYVGATKNGYPHGQGRLTYSRSRQINKNDSKGRTAQAGDQVVGEFYNGFFINGKHLDANGNLIESVMIGVGDESSYDSK